MKKAVEACREGQSDKVCDQIADALVDEYLRRDKQSAVDVHVLGSHGMVMIGGEVRSDADFDVSSFAKKVYKEIGYEDDIEVFVNLEPRQETERGHRSVVHNVVVNGYATRETREGLPRPLVFAQAMARRLDDLRKTDPSFSWLRPDGRVQIMMEKDRVRAVTLLASHTPNIDINDVRTALLDRVVSPIVSEGEAKILINPVGPFTIDGFHADAGGSGQRTANDSYGGLVPFGDASPCGKDPWRVERCGAYLARHVAKYLVEQGLASVAFVNVTYVAGHAEPIQVEASGLSEKSRGAKLDLTNVVGRTFDFRPEAIMERFELSRPLYRTSSVYGHFGRAGFPWEESAVGKTSKV